MGEEERAAASAVLASGMLVQGERVAAFERALAERCGRAHAIACGSGTAALEMALQVLGVEEGQVLCPDLSWPSPAHAIVRAGARPRLVDVDRASWNASADALAAARTAETRAAIVIDQLGTPAEHPAIAEALEGLPIIVDAACSIGAILAGRPAASFGRIACLSFHPRKLVTTGEGGACLTDDADLADALRIVRNHGQRSAGVFLTPAGNQRMTEVAAAIGLVQLGRLDAMIERRQRLAERYHAALSPELGRQRPPASAASNWQTFGITLPEHASAAQRDALVQRLREAGIEAGRLSYALHRIGSLQRIHAGGPFPVAEHLDERGLALPLHPLLEDAEQDRVLFALDEATRALGLTS